MISAHMRRRVELTIGMSSREPQDYVIARNMRPAFPPISGAAFV